jgi:hypothetical protein
MSNTEVIKLNTLGAVWCVFDLQDRRVCSAYFKTVLVIIAFCVSLFVSCFRLYGCDGCHHLDALSGIVFVCYWDLRGVSCWEANFSFRLVPEAVLDIPDYITVLDEEHAIPLPHYFICRRSGNSCLAVDIDCSKDCSVGGLRFIGI